MGTANKERTQGTTKKMISVANVLGESIELENELPNSQFKAIFPHKARKRRANPRKQHRRK